MNASSTNRWASYVEKRGAQPASQEASAPPSSHHGGDGALTLLGIDLESTTNRILLAASATAGAIVLAPIVLPALGIGVDVLDSQIDGSLAQECCNSVGLNVGITNSLTNLIEDKIPVIGSYLSAHENGYIIAPAVTMLGSHAAGAYIEKKEKEKGGSGIAGKLVRITGMAIGVVLSLPALLPSIGHGVQFLARVTGENLGNLAGKVPEASGVTPSNAEIAQQVSDGFKASGTAIARVLGNALACPGDAFANKIGLKAAGSLAVGHLPCILPAAITTASALGTAIHAHQRDNPVRESAPAGSAFQR